MFAVEEIILQQNVLGYRIYAYFFKYKLAIEVDEQGHNERDIDYEIERQKATENDLGWEFIRINPAKQNFNIFVEIGKRQNYITKSTKKLTEKSTKKSLTDKFSNKLLRLEFKSNNSIKTKCLKYVVKKILPNFVVKLFFLSQISLLKFTSCVKFHFCSEITFLFLFK